jgi:hypothetical protein
VLSSPENTEFTAPYSASSALDGIFYNQSASIQNHPSTSLPVAPGLLPVAPHLLIPVYPTISPVPLLYNNNNLTLQQQNQIPPPPHLPHPNSLLSFSSSALEESRSLMDFPDNTSGNEESSFPFFNGAVELSAGAKPFVPQFFAGLSEPPALTSNNNSSAANCGLVGTSPISSSSPSYGTANDLLSAATLLAAGNPANSTFDSSSLGRFTTSGIWSSPSGLSGLGSIKPLDSHFTSPSISSKTVLTEISVSDIVLIGDPFLSLTGANGTFAVQETTSYFPGLLGGGYQSNNAEQFELDASRDIIPDLDSLLSNDMADLQ